MPQNTVYIGRPSKFGNPYPIELYGRETSLENYGIWLTGMLYHNDDFLAELRGKDLACWCPLTVRCHADILLEFLNKLDIFKKAMEIMNKNV